MLILLPLDSDDPPKAKLVSLEKVVVWGLVDLESGKIRKIDFYEDRHEIEDFVDCVVVTSKYEHIWPFVEESIPVLEAPVQRSIEDVIEAFLFKELYEVKV